MFMKTKAAVFQGPGKPFEVCEFSVAGPAPGQAGLRLVSSGICGTDVHIHGGFLAMPDYPMIIGHEFIGAVDSLGAGADTDALGHSLKIGDKAIACVAVPCGKCLNCRRGETASCLAFGVTYCKPVSEAPHLHGGFAEYLFSPAEGLVVLPATVDPFAAAAFPCGGPTIIRACEYGGGFEDGELVVIQGNGSLGLFALAYAKAHRCRVMVIGSAANPERTELTYELGADEFLDFRTLSEEEIIAKIQASAAKSGRGNGADVVIETSGARNAFPLGVNLLRTRGRYFVPGQYSNRGPVEFEPQKITFKALQITGSGQYTKADIGTYLDFLAKNRNLQEIFRRLLKTFRIADVNAAMAEAADGKTIKAVFAME